VQLYANLSEICLELPDPNIVDAHRFRTTAEEALSGKEEALASDALDRAVSFYGGPFLEDYDDDWVLNQRERLQSLYLRSLTKLMGSYARQNRIEAAIACGRRILACDPMRETIQRAVMILYVLNSQRGEAIHQFARCKKALRQECDVDPAPETCALFALIRSGDIFVKLSDLAEKEIARAVDADPALLRL
jgi:DNA-binding SARP family transcriptional activator